jgi:hypothetical protein
VGLEPERTASLRQPPTALDATLTVGDHADENRRSLGSSVIPIMIL